MRGNSRFSQWMGRVMAGRYGADQFSRFLSILACILIVLALPLHRVWRGNLSAALSWLGIAALVWCYIRVFSRNIAARQRENIKYLGKTQKIRAYIQFRKDCFRFRKDYKLYRCPGCGSVVRVPKGKGRIRISCRRCGQTFEKKT